MSLHILNGSGTPNISKIDPSECTILDSSVFVNIA